MAASAAIPKTIYTSPLVHTPSYGALTIEPEAHIGVNEAGTIVFIARSPPDLATKTRIHPFNAPLTRRIALPRKHTTSFLAPGFVDTHTHAPQYPNTGLHGTSTLLSWLQRYTFPTEARFAATEYAARVYARVVARCLANGTTAAAYFATTHVPATNALADTCLGAGQRALIGRVCMDAGSGSADGACDSSPADAAARTEACLAHCASIDPEGAVVRGAVTPRFAPSCGADTLAALGRVQGRWGCWAQTHVSENEEEVALVRRLFPDAAGYVDVYDRAGLVNGRCVLAHAIYLTAEEVAVVRQRGAKVSHCPASNTALTSGMLRLKELHAQGVTVGLGTDMSGGYSPSILEMARQAISVSRHVAMAETTEQARENAKLTVPEAFYFATVGGATTIGLEHQVGTFEVGKDFDAQLIRLHHVSEDGHVEPQVAPVDCFGEESWEDAVAKWMYTGDDRNVIQVWVKGRRVHGLEELPPSTTRVVTTA